MQLFDASSLDNSKPKGQVFACLSFSKHNQYMDTELVKTRRTKLAQWFSGDRVRPEKEKSYLSQLIAGKAPFGEKAARRLERDYGMPDRYLDGQSDQLEAISVEESALLTMIRKKGMSAKSVMVAVQALIPADKTDEPDPAGPTRRNQVSGDRRKKKPESLPQ